MYQGYFNEYDSAVGIYTYNTKLKKRLTTYAATCPDLWQLIEDDKQGRAGIYSRRAVKWYEFT